MDRFPALTTVEEPFRSRMTAFLDAARHEGLFRRFGDELMCVGEAVGICGNVIDTKLFKFFPGKGWCLDDACESRYSISIPDLEKRPTNFFVGAHFVCKGMVSHGGCSNTVHFDTNVAICTRPTFDADMTWSVIHLFSGWGQAMAWINTSDLAVNIGQQLDIDCAPEVIHHRTNSLCVDMWPILPF